MRGETDSRHRDHVRYPDATEPPLVVSIVAPSGCGKTAYLAALSHLGRRAGVAVADSYVRVHDLRGYSTSPENREAASRHLREVYHSLLTQGTSVSSSGWYAYEMYLERQGLQERRCRQIYLLDAQGGFLYPGAEAHYNAQERHLLGHDGAPLAERLRELGLHEAEQALLVFVNEPTPLPRIELSEQTLDSEWRMHHHVPAALATYLDGVSFSRVALYAACADVLFPRLGDVRSMLSRLNRWKDDQRALDLFFSHFRGSAHYDFTLDLIQFLHRGGLTATTEISGVSGDQGALCVFWGSSFGVERATGRPNILPGSSPSALKDRGDWNPLYVLEPILWCADLLPSGRWS